METHSPDPVKEKQTEVRSEPLVEPRENDREADAQGQQADDDHRLRRKHGVRGLSNVFGQHFPPL